MPFIKLFFFHNTAASIILSVIREFINSKVIAIDFSINALRIAMLNTKVLNFLLKVYIYFSNWFFMLSKYENFDIIISNPPYINIEEYFILCNSILKYEPRIALSSIQDVLKNYRTIIKYYNIYLNINGLLIFEIGNNQYLDIKNILYQKNVLWYKDIYNLNRIFFIL